MDRKEYSNILLPNVLHDYKYYEEKYPQRNLDKGSMVTRFAPSPTGFVHMGSLYTSFSDLVFAHQTNGVCYLRIEDTDGKRTVENGVQGILDDFKNLGISFDEDPEKGGKYAPYIQSERGDIYKAFAKKLIEEDKAYPCFCSEDDLNEIRTLQEVSKDRIGYYASYARCRDLKMEDVLKKIENGEKYIIRLKSQGNFNHKIILDDVIKGQIEMPENDMDIVIIKGDGLPTYHFAHAVDDHLMHTTHVFRGDEWVASYPVHEQLFKMLDFPLPKYGHIAPITIKEGDKIRINDFTFTFDKMPVGGSLFDIEKLMNISKIYFSRQSGSDIFEKLLPYLEKYDEEFYNIAKNNKEKLIKVLNIEKYIKRPRKDIVSFSDVRKYTWYMFDELYNDDAYKNVEVKDFYNINILQDYFDNFYDIRDDKDTWFNKIKLLAEKYNFAKEVKEYKNNPNLYKGHVGDVCELIRVGITSLNQTPDLYEILKYLDKNSIQKRITMFSKIL